MVAMSNDMEKGSIKLEEKGSYIVLHTLSILEATLINDASAIIKRAVRRSMNTIDDEKLDKLSKEGANEEALRLTEEIIKEVNLPNIKEIK